MSGSPRLVPGRDACAPNSSAEAGDMHRRDPFDNLTGAGIIGGDRGDTQRRRVHGERSSRW